MYALEGIQYSSITSVAFGTNWSPWKDVEEHTAPEFTEGTRFRIKPPQWRSKVTVGNLEPTFYQDADEMAEDIQNLLGQGTQDTITIQNITAKPLDISTRKLQYRVYIGRNIWSSWVNVENIENLPEASPLSFRIRPDFQYETRTSIGGSNNDLTYDDVSVLIKHINRVLSENSVDTLSVKRVPYGV